MTFRSFRSMTLRLTALTLLSLLGPQHAHSAEEGLYVDRNYGFSFSMPRFTPSRERDVTTIAVTLSGSPIDGFSPNVNVMVQNIETTLEAFQKLQAEELRSVGWQVVEQAPTRVAGKPALRTHARGSLQGLEVEFLAVALIGSEKQVFVLTCTTTTSQFPRYAMEFDRVVSSFTLDSD